MSQLPQGWIEAPLRELCVINPKHPSDTDRNILVSFVPMPAVSDTTGTIELHEQRPLKEVWKGFTHFRNGDLIFAKITPCMENGKIAVAQGLCNGLACGSTEFHVLRPHHGICCYYVWRFLRQPSFRVEAERHMTGAVGQRRVPKAYLEECHLPLPPEKEQRRIVGELDRLFARTKAARDELCRIPTLIEHYKQAILRKAFTGELTAGWRKENGITATWRFRKVGESIQSIVAGKNLRCEERPPKSEERGVLKISAVTWGEFNPLASKTLPANFDPPERTRVRAGDLLFSRANTLELVGAIVLVRKTPSNLYLSDKVLRLETAETDKPWLLWFLRSPAGRAAIEASATGNQFSMRNLSQEALRGITMPWPASEERTEIVRRIATSFARMNEVETEQKRVAELFPKLNQAILHKAFRGELVSQDPDEEPAAVLLKRIRESGQRDGGKKRGRDRADVDEQ